ncbi:MAG: DUF2141 domain-containing protein [Saprospiraceae bacterium]
MKILSIVLLCSAVFCCMAFAQKPNQGSLTIKVDNIKSIKGKVWVGIYDSKKNFMDRDKALVEGFEVEGLGQIICRIPQLAFGTYAIAVFHDENNNGELDTNFLGIPKEPYGFSVKPKSKWRVPRFREVKFDFNQVGQELQILLEKW